MALTSRTFSKISKQITTAVSTTSNHHFRRHFSTPDPSPPWTPNGSMKKGPRGFRARWATKEGLFGWILMPGVPKANVTVTVTNNRVYFKGEEQPFLHGLEKMDLLRTYKGSFDLDTDQYDAAKVTAEMSNGLFWFHIPSKKV